MGCSFEESRTDYSKFKPAVDLLVRLRSSGRDYLGSPLLGSDVPRSRNTQVGEEAKTLLEVVWAGAVQLAPREG